MSPPPVRPVSPGRVAGEGGCRARLAGLLAVAVAVLGSCGPSRPSPARIAAEQAFLGQVHQSDPTVNAVRSNVQLVRLGRAACTVFSAGLSYQATANQIGAENGDLPSNVLGIVITAAAEHLCPKYAALVR